MHDAKAVTANRREDYLAGHPSDGRCYFCRFNLLHSEREHLVKVGRMSYPTKQVGVEAASEIAA